VTFGERGCGIYKDGVYTEVPGCKVEVADTVGAGDAFAAAFLHGLDQGWDVRRCAPLPTPWPARSSRAGAIPQWDVEEVRSMLA